MLMAVHCGLCAAAFTQRNHRAFEQQQEGSRGPATRGDLAWLLTKRLLKKYTWVHHITQHPDDGRELQEWVRDWQTDYFRCTG